MFVDTHAHLQWSSFDGDREQALARAAQKGVTRIINVGIDVNGSRKCVELAGKHRGLYVAVGMHPHDASKLDAKTLEVFRKLAEDPKVVAIGEIGLDFYRNLSPRKAQKQAFQAQLQMAQELDLPVVIHDRDAHSDILQTLTMFKGKVGGVMHCFSGNNEYAAKCVDLGFLVSFAGTVTYPNARELHEVARWIDLKSMLLETDCPWLAPQTMRGKRNEPSFVPMIAQRIAELKGLSVEEVATATSANAERIFGLC